MSDLSLPVVAIIGRPNVGKSALFNRLVQRRQSLVDATPGLTRDRLYGVVTWRGKGFRIVDTGGLQFSAADRIQEAVAAQVARALSEASFALFVMDGRDGLLPLDWKVADWIRRSGKPVMPVVNKVDGDLKMEAAHEFAELGLGVPQAISSLHGLGIGELLDAIVQKLPPDENRYQVPNGQSVPGTVRIAIIGRPNVGKSSLLNRFLNQERVLVDDRPGTTRDPVETEFSWKGQKFCWIDTAGIRARKTVKSRVDAVARLKAMEAIAGAEVCLGVLEATAGILRDDLRLLDEVISAGKPLCLAVNKWDLIPPPSDPQKAAAGIARRAAFLRFAPVVCTSAKTGFQVFKLIEQVTALAAQARRRLTSRELRDILEFLRSNPKAPAGLRSLQMIRLSQIGSSPPAFHLMVRMRGRLSAADTAYVQNTLRERGGFGGVPVRIHFLVKRR